MSEPTRGYMVGQSVGTTVRVTIERLTAELRQSTQLVNIANAGRFPPRALGLYLDSLRYLFVQSQRNLQLAATVTRERGDNQLAEYFARKAAEEHGHDAWAMHDLSLLPAASTQGIRPARAVLRLAELQRSLLARHPFCFFAYALWAEYFTSLAGQEWIEALGQSGYSPGQLTAVGNHVIADREHAREGFDVLDELWRGEPSCKELCEGIMEAVREFENFCGEVYAVATHTH